MLLQVVTNRDTQETLLCMACVFEVSNSEHGAQHHIYRLVKEWEAPPPLTYPSPPSVGPSFHRLTDLRDKWQCLYLTVTPALFCFILKVGSDESVSMSRVCQSTAAVICGTVVFCVNMGTLVDMLSCCPLRRLCGRSHSVCSLNGNVRVCVSFCSVLYTKKRGGRPLPPVSWCGLCKSVCLSVF